MRLLVHSSHVVVYYFHNIACAAQGKGGQSHQLQTTASLPPGSCGYLVYTNQRAKPPKELRNLQKNPYEYERKENSVRVQQKNTATNTMPPLKQRYKGEQLPQRGTVEGLTRSQVEEENESRIQQYNNP